MNLAALLAAARAKSPASPAPTSAPAPRPAPVPYEDPERRTLLNQNAVQPSEELSRINALPRRVRPDENALAALVEKWNGLLAAPGAPRPGQCDCEARFGTCIHSLNELQAWSLEEFSKTKGVVGKLAVGAGKTGLDVLLPLVLPETVKVAVLLLRAPLIDPFVEVDYPQWSVHFRTPNLDSRYASASVPGRPTLYIYSYNEVSLPKNTGLLDELRPDMIIADECQMLANETSARTKRFIRSFQKRPEMLYVGLSGSIQTKTIMQSGHHFALALREGSPLPVDATTRKRWAKAIDPTPADHMPAPVGALRVFCRPGEDIAVGYGRRVNETAGVVSSEQSSVNTPLFIKTRPAPKIPDELAALIQETRATGVRPDGEEPETAFQKAAWLKQMACGFYYHFRFPHGEPEELILKWFAARKNFHKEVRDKLAADADEGTDSPTLLLNAARRYHSGYKGKLPVWASVTYLDWVKVASLVRPAEGLKWLDDYLLNDAVAWAGERKAAGEGGIIWCEFREIGQRLARRLGVEYFNGGDWAAALRAEKGDRVVVCSIKGHGTGSNLQRFRRHLVVSNPADAGIWEQLLGRSHRFGQTEAVTYEVYRHTPELDAALDKAFERAAWLEQFDGSPQKLLLAKTDF